MIDCVININSTFCDHLISLLVYYINFKHITFTRNQFLVNFAGYKFDIPVSYAKAEEL